MLKNTADNCCDRFPEYASTNQALMNGAVFALLVGGDADDADFGSGQRCKKHGSFKPCRVCGQSSSVL